MTNSGDIRVQTRKMLWDLENVIECLPDEMWERRYCGAPVWQHVYHTLHSLDRWFINPAEYSEPPFHTEGLNDLDAVPSKTLSRGELREYFGAVSEKIGLFTASLRDDMLQTFPNNCKFTVMTLILGSFRHTNAHLGMLMGFIIAETGEWPFVTGLERDIPDGIGIFS